MPIDLKADALDNEGEILTRSGGLPAGITRAALAADAAFSGTYAPLRTFDVMNYGAAADGVTDDTDAVNDAVAAAVTAGGGVVFAPTGVYAIGGVVDVSTLTEDVCVDLRGAGMFATVFLLTDAAAQIRFSDAPVVATGMRGSLSGDFNVNADGTATDPLFFGQMAERSFSRIRVYDAAVGGAGVTLSGTQNCVFSQVTVHDCAGTGLRIDAGAGGNTFFLPEVRANARNVEFTVTFDGSYAYDGIPTDNKLFGGLIEDVHGGGTDAHLYYGGGAANYLIGTRITGTGATAAVKITADDGSHVPAQLHLIGVDIQETGIGIDSTVNGTTYLTHCSFTGLATGFKLGDTSLVEIDRYVGNNVTTRFANQSGGSNSEENLLRSKTVFPRQFTGETSARYGLLNLVTGDSVPRFAVSAGGTLEWGPGSGARDVALSRGTANRLDLAAGDSLRADVMEVNGTAGAGYFQFNNEQSSAPAAPTAGRARLFIRDDGTATELAMRTDSETTALVTASSLAADFGLGHKAVRKAADETLNDNATMQADDELLFAIGANETWVGRVVAFLAGSGAADFKVDITVPAGATVTYGGHHARAADTVMVSTGVATAGDTDLTAINAASVLTVEFSVANGATPGNVNFRWAQNAATVADSTVKAGSYLETHRIA